MKLVKLGTAATSSHSNNNGHHSGECMGQTEDKTQQDWVALTRTR